ncbi:MAG: restriction endonuclease [Chloroflexi bacterium]|nr:restriction endonuclease [Chloroflexota bacterium]MBP8059496.1 restriction endonuclease [Chloroflexota bacterium]
MLYRAYWETEQWFSVPLRQKEKTRPQGLFASGWWIIGGFTLLTLGWMLYHALWQPYWLMLLPEWGREFIHLVELSAFLTLLAVWGMLGWRQTRPRLTVAPPFLLLELEQLLTFPPAEFEAYVAGLFRRKGYVVRRRGGIGDMGVDLELLAPGQRRAIVQCKRYQNTVGAELVRELYGTLIHEKALHAFLITTADISPAAREWVKGKPITLIDGEMLMQIAAALETG